MLENIAFYMAVYDGKLNAVFYYYLYNTVRHYTTTKRIPLHVRVSPVVSNPIYKPL